MTNHRMRALAALALILAVCPGLSLPAHGAGARRVRVFTRYFPSSGAPLVAMVQGIAGTGIILYSDQRSWRHPRLVVRLTKQAGAGAAVAEIYDAPPGSRYVPIHLTAGGVVLPPGLLPVITMHALGGWWLRRGEVNYNLDIQIYGRLNATWGAGGIPLFLPPLSRHPLQPGAPIFNIETRADRHGAPLWDMRTVVPEFPGSGYYRTNYAQRECSQPLRRVPSVSPLWPYVAFSGAFEQSAGTLRPPIVVNWRTGRVTAFSEIVTVRHQKCSYDLYSLTRVIPGGLNTPDFESPWGLYDLSGRGNWYPNLIIRTEHFYPHDPYSPSPRSNEVVRYSWADHPGNERFSYKVDVFGFHPYTTSVRIAGGRLRIAAPSYTHYPNWVIGKRWPVTTFVDATGSSALTSEGIYSWSSNTVGQEYLAGQADAPHLSQFRAISPGQRGEYRIGLARRPWLYASPIDRRLHLIDAQQGLWNLGQGSTVREGNLDGGSEIDDWQRIYRAPLRLPLRFRETRAPRWAPPALEAEIAFLRGYLLYAGPHGAVIQRTAAASERFRILPPTGKTSWRTFTAATMSYRRGRNPHDFYSWLKALPGPALRVPGGSLTQIEPTSEGFQAVVTVPRATERPARRLHRHVKKARTPVPATIPGLVSPSQPGRYVLTYSAATDRWAWSSATPPHLRIAIHPPPNVRAYLPANLTVSIRNSGTEAWHRPLTVMVDGLPLYSGDPRILGLGTWHTHVPWSPPSDGAASVAVTAGSHLLQQHLVRVAATPRASPAVSLRVTIPNLWIYSELLGLLLAILSLTWFLWRRALVV